MVTFSCNSFWAVISQESLRSIEGVSKELELSCAPRSCAKAILKSLSVSKSNFLAKRVTVACETLHASEISEIEEEQA